MLSSCVVCDGIVMPGTVWLGKMYSSFCEVCGAESYVVLCPLLSSWHVVLRS